MSIPIDLPHDVLSYHDNIFYDLVRGKCGGIVEEIFKFQKIRSAQTLLRITDIFDFMSYDSDDLNVLKQKVGFRLNNGQYQIKPGILMDVDSFLQSLRIANDNLLKAVPIDYSSDNFTISQDFLRKHPIIMSLIQYYSIEQLNSDDTGMSFLNSLMKNITQNLSRPKNSYRYNEHVKRFAVSLYILAGRNAYEFVRINIPGAFPSTSTIQSFLDEEERHMKEGEFRFDIVRRHLSLTNTNIAFCSEDCTAIIPKVAYDINSNSFVGFSLPLDVGRPITDHYRTESFAQLESWFSSVDKSTLLNIHMIQPITSTEQTSSPIILSAYGTNSKYTSIDIIRRWIWIFDECLAKGIRIIGFSTDGDPKYLKAMKLVLGFFASLPNMKISDRPHAFEVSRPDNWNWFFLRQRQLILCFQDPIHICTKLRNRLLSTTAEMIIGNQRISLDLLSEMIASRSKLKHGLVKSDIYPHDKQNFASCEKISSNSVISTLEEISNSLATRLYLRLIRSVIIAYIDRATSINDRVYHAWFTVFLCRIWWAWLLTKTEHDSDEMLSRSSHENSSQSIGKLKRKFLSQIRRFNRSKSMHIN
ncbi:unnamed protein product [Rotaria sp. Silwood2]|nr:unnamed protein product [Rotaria sp. Silwood2]CAF4354081.1 unnamed protein product [Rotaria sp. Silwood2]